MTIVCAELRPPAGSERSREGTYRWLVAGLSVAVAIATGVSLLWAGKPFGGSIKDWLAAIGIGLGVDLGVSAGPTLWSSIADLLKGPSKEVR
jgi:hypothetical protein